MQELLFKTKKKKKICDLLSNYATRLESVYQNAFRRLLSPYGNETCYRLHPVPAFGTESITNPVTV
jgi:hypothetical protein